MEVVIFRGLSPYRSDRGWDPGLTGMGKAPEPLGGGEAPYSDPSGAGS